MGLNHCQLRWLWRSPRGHRKRLAFLICVILGVAGSLILFRVNEPDYKGRSLSQWLEAYSNSGSTNLANPSAGESIEAIRHIGTNALPYMLRWIPYSKLSWRKQLDHTLDRAGSKVPRGLRHALLDKSLVRAETALDGFEILGTQAKSAVPELARLVRVSRDTRASDRAMLALAYLGPDGLATLAAALVDSRTPNRKGLTGCIRRAHELGSDIDPALPAILKCFSDNDKFVASGARALVLGWAALEPQTLVPAVTNCLQRLDEQEQVAALQILSNLGDAARLAEPSVTQLVRSSHPETQNAASNALRAITIKRGIN